MVEPNEELSAARKVIVEMLKRGELVRAAELFFDRAFAPLFELSSRNAEQINRLTRDVSELRATVSDLTVNVEKLMRQMATIAPTVGKLDRRYAKLEESALRETLGHLCFRRGFDLDVGIIERGRPSVDAIITGKGLIALVEIALRGNSGDVKQLLEASKAYEEVYGDKPNVLFLLSIEEPDEITFKRAEEKGVRVVLRPRRIVDVLEEISRGRT